MCVGTGSMKCNSNRLSLYIRRTNSFECHHCPPLLARMNDICVSFSQSFSVSSLTHIAAQYIIPSRLRNLPHVSMIKKHSRKIIIIVLSLKKWYCCQASISGKTCHTQWVVGPLLYSNFVNCLKSQH